MGDRVLIRTVGLQGKHKIADRWDGQPYKVLKQLIPDIPVFDVQKEDGTGRVKTLHRNELLPITSLPIEELNSAEVAVKTARNRRILDVPDTTVSALTSDSTDSTSSEDEESNEDEPPESQTYRIPMRRNHNEPGLRPRTHPQGRTTGNELLPITSLPIEELNSAEVAVKTARNRRILDVPDTTASALTSDSTDSTSSEDEDSNENEPPESQTYRIPMRRNPNEPGLRPRTHPQGRTTGRPTGRPQRNRQVPGWMQSGSWLMQ